MTSSSKVCDALGLKDLLQSCLLRGRKLGKRNLHAVIASHGRQDRVVVVVERDLHLTQNLEVEIDGERLASSIMGIAESVCH